MEIFKRILIIIIFVAFFVFIITLQGCRTIEKIEYVTKYDTCYVSKEVKDSVYLKDSIYVYTKADTVYFTKYKERVRYITKTDTVFKASVDTLIQNKEVIKEVEKKRPVRDFFAIFGIAGILAIIGIMLYKLKIK